MIRNPRFLLLLCLALLYAVVGFLTLQSLQHRQQAAQMTLQQQGQRDLAQLTRLVDSLLIQRQNQLSAISEFLPLTPDGIRELVAKTPMITDVLVLENRQVRYPAVTSQTPLSRGEQQFLNAMTPLIDDPSLLRQHLDNDSQPIQPFGWFVGRDRQQTTLLYWQQQGSSERVLVFALSYAVFRAEVIAGIDELPLSGLLRLFDNGQLLLENGVARQSKNAAPVTVSHTFAHPLAQWSAQYQPTPATTTVMTRWWPVWLALAVLALLTLLAVLTYRAVQRRWRLAGQQVQFVGQVSHELKTPLTTINLYTQMLAESEHDNPQTQQYLQVIEQESARLTRLIQNVLNFNQAPTLNRQTVNIAALLQQVEQTFAPVFADRGLQMRVTLGEGVDEQTVINSDSDKLVQILGNLLSNAEKYAADGKWVDITAAQTAKAVQFSVRDYGRGVSKSELKQLFKPFYRVHNQITEGVAGTGIGLTIAQQLAAHLGGDLQAQAMPQGLCFMLTVPKAVVEK